MAMSLTPVFWLIESTFFHDLPPSVVLNTPRVSFSVHSWPAEATYTMSGLVGWTTIRPIGPVSGSPMCCQVRALSVDLYTPTPEYELRKMFDSPVPIHTMSGLDGATARAPVLVAAA